MKRASFTYNGTIGQFSGLNERARDLLAAELVATNEQILYKAQSAYNVFERQRLIDSATTYLFDRKNDLIPSGLMRKAIELLKEEGWTIEIKSLLSELVQIDLPDQLKAYLRDYQKAAIESGLLKKRGIWQMPTGAGKTKSAASFMLCFPKARILFTVPSIRLANQAREEFANFLGESIGAIGDGECQWERVTVGIINSLVHRVEAKDPELEKIDIVFHDEVHVAGSPSYLKLSQALTKQQYVIGLSATPERSDGCGPIVEAVSGQIIYKVKDEQVAQTGATNLPTYLQISSSNRYIRERKAEPLASGSLSPAQILKLYDYAITTNHERTQIVIDLVTRLLALPSRQGNILVLFEYIKHGELLVAELAKNKIEAPLLHGKTQKKLGQELLTKFTKNNIPLLVASKVLEKGVDLPELEFLILAGASSNNNTHIQQIGRTARTNSQYKKLRSVVFDFTDGDFYFNRRSKRRLSFAIKRYGIEHTHCCNDVPSALLIAESKLK